MAASPPATIMAAQACRNSATGCRAAGPRTATSTATPIALPSCRDMLSTAPAHLGVPRAVLSDRLGSLTEAGVLRRSDGAHGHTEYLLTDKGMTLWPVVRSLLAWGDEHYSAAGPSRVFRHAADGGAVSGDGVCAACGQEVPVRETLVAPGPGLVARSDPDPVTEVLSQPHSLLAPIRA